MRIDVWELGHGLTSSDFRWLDIRGLTIGSGAHVVVLGNSGSGKTSLLRALLGLTANNTRTSGEVVVGDGAEQEEQVQLSGQALEAGALTEVVRCAYVPQSGGLFPPHLNVGEVLRDIGRVYGVDGLDESLHSLGLAAEVRDKLDSPPSRFSGGEQRRLALAAAFMAGAEFICLDEPTAGLDDERVRDFSDLVRELPQTMLIATHDYAFARTIADHVAFLQSGHLVESATAEEFFSGPVSPPASDYHEVWQKLLHPEDT